MYVFFFGTSQLPLRLGLASWPQQNLPQWNHSETSDWVPGIPRRFGVLSLWAILGLFGRGQSPKSQASSHWCMASASKESYLVRRDVHMYKCILYVYVCIICIYIYIYTCVCVHLCTDLQLHWQTQLAACVLNHGRVLLLVFSSQPQKSETFA